MGAVIDMERMEKAVNVLRKFVARKHMGPGPHPDGSSQKVHGGEYGPKAVQAGMTFRRRQDREEHPEGEFDKGGRWYPKGKDAEVFDYNRRSPSRAWPYSYMLHARTAEHVAKLFGVTATEVRKAGNAIKKLKAQGLGATDILNTLTTTPALAKAVRAGDDGTAKLIRAMREKGMSDAAIVKKLTELK